MVREMALGLVLILVVSTASAERRPASATLRRAAQLWGSRQFQAQTGPLPICRERDAAEQWLLVPSSWEAPEQWKVPA